MSRTFSKPQPFGLFVLVALGALVLGFALTYGWTRQSPHPQSSHAALSVPGQDKDQDGLVGPVNRVRTETAKLFVKSGGLVEGPRELLESTTYAPDGNRVDNSYYLTSARPQPGAEEYAYDEKGNVSETTVRDENNSLLGKEVYTYEYDAVGNWTKMITSEVTYEKGALTQQPSEVTYRQITYYYDHTIADIIKSAPATQVSGNLEVNSHDEFTDLRGRLDEWIAATNARDMAKLMDFYDARLSVFYLARNVSREFVRAEKARQDGRAEMLEVRAGAPEIIISDDPGTAVMRFHKEYFIKEKGRDHRGEVLQQLTWRQTGGKWIIVGERDTQAIR